MWKPPINFITLHYAYILIVGISSLVVVYPYGNLRAIDSYFFGVSASTSTGLNPVDVKALKTYQQVWYYFTPIITNLGFINIIVVVVRLRWFHQKLKGIPSAKIRPRSFGNAVDPRTQVIANAAEARDPEKGLIGGQGKDEVPNTARITFAPDPRHTVNEKGALRVTGPCEEDNGQPTSAASDEDDQIKPVVESINPLRRRISETRSMSKATSVDRAVSSIFVLGSTVGARRSEDRGRPQSVDLKSLSREELGGVEYRALQVLLKIASGYFFGLHLFGALCLIPWIHLAPSKYKDYVASQGQDSTWWAIYSAQSLVDNTGLVLTPDSMISFRDAAWPMLVMSFLCLAGNTLYPCLLRVLIWILWKMAPAESSYSESLRFLLDHPRRCYTLLFPSTATWVLAGIVFVLNFVDTLLIIVLDLDNPEVNVLPVGHRILAALFQSASSRHTGTASFNLANVNPAVQFSLLVMMYISVYPIAISIRMSESYEESPVGLYAEEESLDDNNDSKTYLINHLRNQLSFDLWYIFLGVFFICIAESDRIMSKEDWAFTVFTVFFEVVSAYGNVGLSLGYPTNLCSLSGQFTLFSKLVICAMMIRGRHRGLPYALDRAINLPNDLITDDEHERYTDFDTEGTAITREATESKEEGKFAKSRRLVRSLTQ